MSVCFCCTHLFSFFTLAFVLANDLSLVSRCFLFWKCVRFCFRFCCRLFLFVVCSCVLCLLPCHTRCSFTDVLSCTPSGVSEINHLTCLDLTYMCETHTMGGDFSLAIVSVFCDKNNHYCVRCFGKEAVLLKSQEMENWVS